MGERRIRILVAKPGLDGHDRGAKVICRALRDAGYEVIYTGLRRTPEEIVSAAIQEDVDVVGLSILSGTHLTVCKELMEKMEKQGIDDKIVTVGGIIPKKDVNRLMEFGIAKVFRPSDNTSEIVGFIEGKVQRRAK